MSDGVGADGQTDRVSSQTKTISNCDNTDCDLQCPHCQYPSSLQKVHVCKQKVSVVLQITVTQTMSRDMLSPTVSEFAAGLLTIAKCRNCGKKPGTKGCVAGRCINCCEESTCARHNRTREQLQMKEQILAGTTDVQRMAREKRSKLLKPGRFRETGFLYQGDTVVIWNIRDYVDNEKWRDDAVRKSLRRKVRQMDIVGGECKVKPVVSGKRRFRKLMDERYHILQKRSSINCN